VEFSNRESGAGMVLGVSDDGGLDWKVSTFARRDKYGSACCDPTITWDQNGNLFMAWLDLRNAGAIRVAISLDAGHTLRMLKTLRPNPPRTRAERDAATARLDGNGDGEGDDGEKPGGGEKERDPSPKGSVVDQPTIAAGQGSVWVTWNNEGVMQAVGAPVQGLGEVGSFGKVQQLDRTRDCNFGDIAIGPIGQVFEVCTKDREGTDPTVATIRASTDPDGLGPLGFTAARAIGATNVQQFDAIPPQPARTVDPESGLAWDTDETSPHFGRLYLMWTSEQPNESNDTDVWLRSTDDAGVTWSAAVRVNDVTTNAQFLPRIALDPTTGNLAIGWHDARNDLGDGGGGDTDATVNTDAMYYVTFSTDGGATFALAVAASMGASNADVALNGIDFGDYTGLAFYGGIAMPAWADNSNSTGDNPAGALETFEIYTARVSLT
jgi:hypothetical protein